MKTATAEELDRLQRFFKDGGHPANEYVPVRRSTGLELIRLARFGLEAQRLREINQQLASEIAFKQVALTNLRKEIAAQLVAKCPSSGRAPCGMCQASIDTVLGVK